MAERRGFLVTFRENLRSWLLLIGQFRRLALAYWIGDEKWRAWALTTVLVLLTGSQVAVAVALNIWFDRLFDSLEQRDFQRFLILIVAFFAILAANMAVLTTHLRIKRRLQIAWRNWLTRRLIGEWMADGRHYLVTHLPGDHDNPDGRIAEDIRIVTERAIELMHSLLYCLLILISFTSILWELSGTTHITFGRTEIFLPGYLVWLAILFSATGTTIAILLGRPLVRAANRRQSAEQDFRFGLADAREKSLAVALVRGEEDARDRFARLFRRAVAAWNRQTAALANLMFFTSGWSMLPQIFPILVVAPRYIAGTITLGVLMQTAQAFQQMTGALSWPIDNIPAVAEWRASVERVQALHEAVDRLKGDAWRGAHPTIELSRGEGSSLKVSGLSVSSPEGEPIVAVFDGEIRQGERLLLSGDQNAIQRLLMAALGLWPWGSGRVLLPKEAHLLYMPAQPYLPRGTLQDAICQPAGLRDCNAASVRTALDRVGLAHLADRLDKTEIWEETLLPHEQARLGFARLLLRRPDWILLADALEACDAAGEADMIRLLREEFPRATVIAYSRRPIDEGFFGRRFRVERKDGIAVVEETSVAASRP
jgi:putative ATP-binding cassette transporter